MFQNADDFAEFLAMTKKQSDLYGNKFTYTLIDERAYVRATRRYATYLGFTTILLAAWIGFRTYKNKTIIPKFK